MLQKKNFAKAVPSCLYKNVCFEMRNPGLISRGFHDKVVSILSFLFAKRKSFILLSPVGRTGGWFQLHTCFALLCLHKWQCSTQGVDVFHSHSISLLYRRDFLSFQSNHTQRNAYVQTEVCVRDGTNTTPGVALFYFEIWVLIFLPMHLDK